VFSPREKEKKIEINIILYFALFIPFCLILSFVLRKLEKCCDIYNKILHQKEEHNGENFYTTYLKMIFITAFENKVNKQIKF